MIMTMMIMIMMTAIIIITSKGVVVVESGVAPTRDTQQETTRDTQQETTRDTQQETTRDSKRQQETTRDNKRQQETTRDNKRQQEIYTQQDISSHNKTPKSQPEKMKSRVAIDAPLPQDALDELKSLDPFLYFAEPVDDDLEPTYRTIIPDPMDFSTMRQKLMDGGYTKGRERQARGCCIDLTAGAP